MSSIRVTSERSDGDGWRFDVRVEERGAKHDFAVTLGKADYERWSGGKVAPADVIRAAFRFLLAKEPVGSILRCFDASVIRRYFPEVDRELPGML
ncbi:MAG TPA: hypothetical protein VIS07_16590 [Candidatus Binatia bacterium]